jgi:hypothetical protein
MYRGVEMSFGYSTPDAPSNDDMDTRPPDLSTTAFAKLPRDYPLRLRLAPRTDGRAVAPPAPFFATLQGKAAPIDIVTELLEAPICDDLRTLGEFTLATFSTGGPTRVPLDLYLSVPYWVEHADVARRMLDILRRLVLAADDARRRADAAANADKEPYRGIGRDPVGIHEQRLAEIRAAGEYDFIYRPDAFYWKWTLIILVGLTGILWLLRAVWP